MKHTVYTVITVLALSTLSGCSSVVFKDPRCTPRQWCPYTDAPAPIRTEVLRTGSGLYTADPAVR